jgi:hypothetical protein
MARAQAGRRHRPMQSRAAARISAARVWSVLTLVTAIFVHFDTLRHSLLIFNLSITTDALLTVLTAGCALEVNNFY